MGTKWVAGILMWTKKYADLISYAIDPNAEWFFTHLSCDGREAWSPLLIYKIRQSMVCEVVAVWLRTAAIVK